VGSALALTAQRRGPRRGDRERRVAGDLPFVEGIDPTSSRLDLTGSDRVRPRGSDELAGNVDVPGRVRVRDGSPDEIVLAVPAPRAAVQLRHEFRLAARELGARVLREQVVIAIGHPLLVERYHEQVAALELTQHRVGVAALRQRIAQRGGELIEHRRLPQESDRPRRLASEDVICQEVGDVSRRAREMIDERLWVLPVAQRQRGQVHRSRPALGALDEPRDEAIR
jgi:hypothetical protein